ncbi:MAG: DUF2924 domain-containing protein [Terricaulis sp.]
MRTQQISEADPTLLADIERLPDLNLSAMRELWRQRLRQPYPPKLISPAIFRVMLTYKLRELIEGPLSGHARRKLKAIEKARQAGGIAGPFIHLLPGAVLRREWNGQFHEVHAVDDGFRYDGAHYRSLSEVARAITGTQWSGPRFFGLVARKKS